jgi:hypothetical protein
MYVQDESSSIIALYAIYMPIIRSQVHGFVRTWNVHKIRRQKRRDHLPTGQPIYMYQHPQEGDDNYRTPVNQSKLQELKQPLLSYGKSSYFHNFNFNLIAYINVSLLNVH